MEPGSPVPDDLAARLARLEAQVAWLLERVQGAAPRPVPTPVPPPLPAPPSPRGPMPGLQPASRQRLSPVVWMAGMGSSLFLLGALFFFRWAVQRGWMGPELRFLLGLVAGLALAGFAGRLVLGESRRLGVALLLAGLGTLQFSFRAGALTYRLFDPLVGLAAVGVVTLLAGGLAARVRVGGALTVALVSGLLAPLVFSQGGHHEVALAGYLAVLQGAALAVPYLTEGAAADWRGARWVALLGCWLLLLLAAYDVQRDDAGLLSLLLGVHLLLTGVWTWLPGLRVRPAAPAAMWVVASVLAVGAGWFGWHQLDWMDEAYAVPLLAAAAWNLALVRPVRARLGGRQADLGLLALALGHLALAMPVALAWRWVGPLWGTFALALAWAARRASRAASPGEEASDLRWLALGLALLATLRWGVHGLGDVLGDWNSGPPFFRAAFVEGALAAGTWALLLEAGMGGMRRVAFLAFELTANLTLALEVAHGVQWLQTPGAAGHAFGLGHGASIALTLVWALSGAWQWKRGLGRVGEARRAWMGAGYAWMGVAAAKLLLSDLATADTPLRAVAFLGVGAIGMAAAVLARRSHPEEGA